MCNAHWTIGRRVYCACPRLGSVRASCRCKEPLLEECNLRSLTKTGNYRTRTQGQMVYQRRDGMRHLEEDAEQVKIALSLGCALNPSPK